MGVAASLLTTNYAIRKLRPRRSGGVAAHNKVFQLLMNKQIGQDLYFYISVSLMNNQKLNCSSLAYICSRDPNLRSGVFFFFFQERTRREGKKRETYRDNRERA